MSATLLYRIASVLLLLFALGHTVGFLTFKPPTAESLAVRDAMRNVKFQFGRGTFSYEGFYKGFGLFISSELLFSAYLAWRLGSLAVSNPGSIGALGWVFVALQVASLALSWMYFFPITAIFSGLVAVCVGWAAWLVSGR